MSPTENEHVPFRQAASMKDAKERLLFWPKIKSAKSTRAKTSTPTSLSVLTHVGLVNLSLTKNVRTPK